MAAKKKAQKAGVRRQPTKNQRRLATGHKEYVITLAPTKTRDGWVATVEKNGVLMEGVRVEGPSYRPTLHGMFDALRKHARDGELADNVAWQIKVSARKRQAIERVQPTSNASFGAFVDMLIARREFLHWSRKTVEMLRNDGLSDEDLSQIALCSPKDVRAWLSRERNESWTEIHIAQWLAEQAMHVLDNVRLLRKAPKGDTVTKK